MYLINPCSLGSIFISFGERTTTDADNERVVSAAAAAALVAVIAFLYSGLFTATLIFATLVLCERFLCIGKISALIFSFDGR